MKEKKIRMPTKEEIMNAFVGYEAYVYGGLVTVLILVILVILVMLIALGIAYLIYVGFAWIIISILIMGGATVSINAWALGAVMMIVVMFINIIRKKGKNK